MMSNKIIISECKTCNQSQFKQRVLIMPMFTDIITVADG